MYVWHMQVYYIYEYFERLVATIMDKLCYNLFNLKFYYIFLIHFCQWVYIKDKGALLLKEVKENLVGI